MAFAGGARKMIFFENHFTCAPCKSHLQFWNGEQDSVEAELKRFEVLFGE